MPLVIFKIDVHTFQYIKIKAKKSEENQSKQNSENDIIFQNKITGNQQWIK